jgi:hypothetical protein
MHVAMLPRAGYISIPCLSYFDLTFHREQSETILIDSKQGWNFHTGIHAECQIKHRLFRNPLTGQQV